MKLNDSFSNAVINLKIPKFENFDPLSENIDHPTLKANIKYLRNLLNLLKDFTKGFFFF